jgi:hypothetical protein
LNNLHARIYDVSSCLIRFQKYFCPLR